jgi:CBS domain-containing protein
MLRTQDVTQTNVATVLPDLPVTELEQLLVQEGVSGMPVVEDGEVCGVVSRSDIVRTLAGAEGNAEAMLAYYQEVAGAVPGPTAAPHLASERIATLTVRDIMTRKVVSVAGDRSVREAAQTMISRGVHRVLVTTTGRRLLGIVTTLDLVRAIADGRIGE